MQETIRHVVGQMSLKVKVGMALLVAGLALWEVVGQGLWEVAGLALWWVD